MRPGSTTNQYGKSSVRVKITDGLPALVWTGDRFIVEDEEILQRDPILTRHSEDLPKAMSQKELARLVVRLIDLFPPEGIEGTHLKVRVDLPSTLLVLLTNASALQYTTLGNTLISFEYEADGKTRLFQADDYQVLLTTATHIFLSNPAITTDITASGLSCLSVYESHEEATDDTVQ